MAVANKIYSNEKRVLQKRNSAQQVIFNDADIIFDFWINTPVANRPNTGDLTFNFNVNLDFIVVNFRIGNNTNLLKKVESSSTISKSTKINDDNNGAGNGSNYEMFTNNTLFLPESQRNLIEKLTISQGSVAGIQGYTLRVLSYFPNLIYLDTRINQTPDFKFLENLPSIKSLDFSTSHVGIANVTLLKNSNVEFMIFRNYYSSSNAIDMIKNLPPNLYYFQVVQCPVVDLDLKDFFIGKRFGFSASGAQALRTTTYSGGGIFPQNIEPKHTAIDYILYIAAITNKLSGDDFARFIVDFANQVQSVTIPISQRRIRCIGVAPNTSYTDNTQPLYKTYTAALNYITTTLGITVTFT